MSIVQAARGATRSTNTTRWRPIVSVLAGSAMALVLPFATAPAALAAGRARPASTALTCDGATWTVVRGQKGHHSPQSTVSVSL
jgi:hypothetical protein